MPNLNQPIVLVTEPGKEEEAITRLARVGYDNTIGYLDNGIDAWIGSGKSVDTILSITANDFQLHHYKATVNVLDVRNESEFSSGHLDIATNKPLSNINEWIEQVNAEQTYYIQCAGGYRSMIAASILKANGMNNVVDIAGGFKAILATQLPTVLSATV